MNSTKNRWLTFSIVVGLFAINFIQVQAEVLQGEDPFYANQNYLKQIGVDRDLLQIQSKNNDVVIAIIDTGVDLNHPDLKSQLVSGINLIEPGSPPQDDNGHGTNVTGIIAATANNNIGITGINAKAKIMPIKALDHNGYGDEITLQKAIQFAVDQKVQIIVLSLGFNKYTDSFSKVLSDAESKGILIIAAAGNEGNVVKYPAAFPSVLAVGGVTLNNQPYYLSNTGPELDIVAPWEVYTTALGGGYEYKNGTSMAAPQVAGVASLILNKYPAMRSEQIKNLLMQTTQDLDTVGWDRRTGYGLVRADLALTENYVNDRFEPNNMFTRASIIPIDSEITATFSSKSDQDWFGINSPYNGNLLLNLTIKKEEIVRLVTYDSNQELIDIYELSGDSPNVSFRVEKGINYVQLQHMNMSTNLNSAYKIKTNLNIYSDDYEDNDRMYKAYELSESSQLIIGTFHQLLDEDWFVMKITKPGTLRLKASVDTARMDLVISVQKKGEKSNAYNFTGEGSNEIPPVIEVNPGEYFIQVKNNEGYSFPVRGEYTLMIDYSEKLIDPNEPNEKPYQATSMGLSNLYKGIFESSEDVDWFEFKVTQESLTKIRLSHIPKNRRISLSVYDHTLNVIIFQRNVFGEEEIALEEKLPDGRYYVKLQSNQTFINQLYQLQIRALPIIDGFVDVHNHWAYKDMLGLINKGIIVGYGNYQFLPDRTITRAEATSMVVRALRLNEKQTLNFNDMDPSHWAYYYIATAVRNGIVSGYSDQTFRPDQLITRMEMVSLIAKSKNIRGNYAKDTPFVDIPSSYWGTGILNQMVDNKWIQGYEDRTFRPQQPSTRAEFSKLLTEALK